MARKQTTDELFRKRFRDGRKRRDWSQADVSKLLLDRGVHIPVTAVAKIEAGTRTVRIDELAAIADLFEVSTELLLGRGAGIEDDAVYNLRVVKQTARRVGSTVRQLVDELDDDCAEAARYTFEDREDFDRTWKRVVSGFKEALGDLLFLEMYADDVNGPVGVDDVTPEQRAADKAARNKAVGAMRDSFRRAVDDGGHGLVSDK